MTEQELRTELAVCCRFLEHLGLIDQDGHVSARIPGTDQLLINSNSKSRARVTPGDIIKVGLEKRSAQEKSQAPTELPIHTEIYLRRSDVLAVAHLHPPVTTALSAAGKPYIPVIFHGAIFDVEIPLYDDCRLVNTLDRGIALAETLGQARAAIMRGHGAVVVAESVRAVFFASVYLEDNAKKLYDAYAIGEPRALSAAELAEGPTMMITRVFNKLWNYYEGKVGLDFLSTKENSA